MRHLKTKKGLTLVEMAIVIGIISFLIISVSAGAGMIDNSRIQSASRSVREIATAAHSWLSLGNTTYTNVSIETLKQDNLLQQGFSQTGTNPWGGDFGLSANASNTATVDVQLTQVPQTAADKLQALLKNQVRTITYDSATLTWTATF